MFPISFAPRTRRLVVRLTTLLAFSLVLLTSAVSSRAPRFYDDDPIAREPESRDASKAQPYEIATMYEMLNNLFATPGYKPSGLRAKNVNTIDEVPDSSWFTNRIGTKALTAEELVRGPATGAAPDPSNWTLIRALPRL